MLKIDELRCELHEREMDKGKEKEKLVKEASSGRAQEELCRFVAGKLIHLLKGQLEEGRDVLGKLGEIVASSSASSSTSATSLTPNPSATSLNQLSSLPKRF